MLLTSCTPAEEAAVRLNANGSVDFVSCQAIPDVAKATATTTFRNGPNHEINDKTAKVVALVPPIDHLDARQVIEFTGLPTKWDRVDVVLTDSHGDSETDGIGERGQLSVREWHWVGQDSVIPLPFAAPCEVGN